MSMDRTGSAQGEASRQRSAFEYNIPMRRRAGRIWHVAFQASTIVGIIALTALLYNIINQSFGLVAIENQVEPVTLAIHGVPLEELPKEALVQILEANVSKGLFRRFEHDQPFAERSRQNVYDLLIERVVDPKVVDTWSLYDSIFQRDKVRAEAAEKYPTARLEFRTWLNPRFVRTPQSGDPGRAGVRTAVLGSLWTIVITISTAFPIGVGAAIYLEEYASDNRLNRIIQTNINNLAGVPSIIYGLLGLAIFVRGMEPLSSGALFGAADPTTANGRTILSAAMTLA